MREEEGRGGGGRESLGGRLEEEETAKGREKGMTTRAAASVPEEGDSRWYMAVIYLGPGHGRGGSDRF